MDVFANFRYSCDFIVTTTESGYIDFIERQEPCRLEGFVDLTEIEACIKGWRLLPNRKHTVRIYIGSTGKDWLLIEDEIGHKIEIDLTDFSMGETISISREQFEE